MRNSKKRRPKVQKTFSAGDFLETLVLLTGSGVDLLLEAEVWLHGFVLISFMLVCLSTQFFSHRDQNRYSVLANQNAGGQSARSAAGVLTKDSSPQEIV